MSNSAVALRVTMMITKKRRSENGKLWVKELD